MLTVKANGEVTGGFNAETGKALNESEMVKVAAGATAQKGATTHTGKMQDVTTGEVYYERTTPQGIELVDNNGKKYKGSSANLRPFGIGSDIATQDLLQRQKLQNQLAYEPAIEAAKKGAGYLAEFNAKRGTSFAIAGRDAQGMPLLVDTKTNQMVSGPEGAGAPQGQAGAPQGSATSIPGNTALPANTSAPTTSQAASAPTGNTPAAIESAEKQREKEAESKLKIGEKQTEGIIKHVNENLVPSALGGQQGSDAVKRQMKIMDDPRSNVLFGLYNKAQTNSASDKNWAIVRDVLGGKLDTKDTEVSKAIANVKLTPDEQSLLTQLAADNGILTTASIKSGGFGTQISDRDRISAEKLQLNIGEVPALGMYNGKAQQMFGFDMSRAKSDWSADKNFATVPQLEKAWAKEQARLVEQYGKVADERNAFIKANSDGKSATVGLVRDAYKRYPVPQYDPNINNGQGGWRNMRDRNLNDILKGNR